MRARVAIGCSFFIQGFVFATWCARIPELQQALALSEATLGTLLFMLPLGQFLSMLPNGLAIKRFGSRPMALLAGFLYPAVLVGIGVARSLPLLGALLFAAGIVANLSNTAINTQAVRLERRYRRSIMTLFHGMWSLAGLAAVALNLALTALGVTLRGHFLLTWATCWGLLLFSGGALISPGRPNAPKAEGPQSRGGWTWEPALLWLGIAAFGCMVCEGAVYDWSGVYMAKAIGVAKNYSSTAYLAYMCTMVPCRFVADAVVNRLGTLKVLLGSGLCLVAGLFGVVLSGFLPVGGWPCAVAGFALVGVGTSAVVPLCCSLAGKCRGVVPSVAIAEVSTIGFFGLLIAPPIIGHLADAWGLPAAFAAVTAVGALVPATARFVFKKD